MNTAGLDLTILGPACVAGLLVLATHVPLGMQVLERGIVFIDLAIAQVAGIGVIADGVRCARCAAATKACRTRCSPARSRR